ncbi:DUF4123 domain-containing protein [Jannaschia sp. LMIT008]|uniref:DUF4123 domain-containing protein n=1 Tax=Jannaschia maritima TaxID=3032585 RepID=UPI002810A2A0|nr:DUF4123 domain-containing protein [Jannaschia sp. LMIT008]
MADPTDIVLPDTLLPDPRAEAIELALDALAFEAGPLPASPGEGVPDLYLLLDAAADPEIATMLDAFDDPARCLFDGQTLDDLRDVGPWLCQPLRHGAAWDWFVEEGWGRNWGVLIRSRLPMAKVKTRMKAFLRVTDEAGEAFFFKFFRPRNLLDYVPGFEDGQRAGFFRGIDAYVAEDPADPGRAVALSLDGDGRLHRQAHDLIALGEPRRLRPASPDDAAALLRAAGADTT